VDESISYSVLVFALQFSPRLHDINSAWRSRSHATAEFLLTEGQSKKFQDFKSAQAYYAQLWAK
jgi:hypothetical protein